MANSFKMLWRAPASILGGLLAGVLISVGHHLYYVSIEGSSSEGDRIIAGYRLSNQSFSTAVGTAFAFVVRAFLLFAVGAAYVQVFWQAATHARKANTLEQIDAMFSILSNPFAFRRGSAWWKYPMLLLIALIAWLLPIAFTIPPASLSVVVAPVTTWALETVPNFDFSSLRYAASLPQGPVNPGREIGYAYSGPSAEVQNVANAVASGGTILSITPPAANSSWELDFYGPSLNCHAVNDDSARLRIESTLADWLWNQSFHDGGDRNCYTPKGYLAWSPYAGDGPHLGSDEVYDNIIRSFVYVAVLPDLFEFGGDVEAICDRANLTTQSQPLGPGNTTLLKCDLHNSSYHAAFNYESGEQSVAVQAEQREAVSTLEWVFAPNITEMGPNIFNTTLLRQLSYTAIADAFYQVLRGSVSNNVNNNLKSDTNVISTVLLNTPELSFISSQSNLQTLLWQANSSRGQSLSSPQNVPLGKSLQNAMEEMFQNITISLLSSELLQPNMTSEYAPAMPNVTTTRYEPIFQYAPRQLWIAYGVAIGVSAIGSVFGLLAVFLNRANYSNDFSSVYRTAYSSGLDTVIQPDDMKATDPLPRYLAKAALYITNATPAPAPPPVPDDPPRMTEAMRQDSREALIGEGYRGYRGRGHETRGSDHSVNRSYINLNPSVGTSI
ncbi:hypothetical protein F5X98DRAFT_356691 [Xylaria grammica]|nr:hypothetical protein F5X98DRAFT_356691 [Xylaria grammica]